VLLPSKLSGVYECAKASDHTLVSRVPPRWPVPHSRRNSLDEAELRQSGYEVLSRSPRVGADTFVKQVDGSLFLMFQGHPEYESDCLWREYRRDIKRFLTGRQINYPEVPEGYFDDDAVASLAVLREHARSRRSIELLPVIDASLPPVPTRTWHASAQALYSRWLSHLARQKAERRITAYMPHEKVRA
jgi:homoserine O-succinyltransferase